jgi:hypothetical protein
LLCPLVVQIPSTFASERLGLLKRFEQVKTLEAQQVDVLGDKDVVEEQRPGASEDLTEVMDEVRQSLAESLGNGREVGRTGGAGSSQGSPSGIGSNGKSKAGVEADLKEESNGIGRSGVQGDRF